jgi:outer membrane receptor protein involved in Fe transport
VYNPLNWPQAKGETYTIGGVKYQPIDITDEILLNAGIKPEDFISQNYPGNYEGSLTLPLIEDMPSESNLLGFNLKYRDLSVSFNSMYRRSHSSLGQSTYFFKYNDPQTYWGENIRSTTISYNHEWSNRFSTTTNFSNLFYRMDNNSSQGVTFIDYTDKVYRYSAGNDLLFEQIFNVMPFNKFEIMTGITYQYSGNLPQTNFLDNPFRRSDYRAFSTESDYVDTLSGNFGINPLTFHNISVFTQAYYSVGSLRFMGGVRVDNHSQYGLSVSPRLATQYTLSHKNTIRGSIGYAFKAPPSSMAWQSLAYRSGINYDSLIYMYVPNPNLEPEKYMSVELGVTRNFGKKYHLDLSVYYNEIRNLIMSKGVNLKDLNLPRAIVESDTSVVLTKSNNHNAISRLYGLQATFRANDIVERVHLKAELSLTFAKSAETFPDIVQLAENYFANFKLIPKHYGQMKISLQPTKKLYIQVTSIWESAWQRIFIPVKILYDQVFNNKDGYYSMDIVADYQIGNNLHTFVKGNNIFNEKYGGLVYSVMSTPLPYNPQSGRTIQFGLTYTFN